MLSLATSPYHRLLIPIRTIYHHPGGEFLVWTVTGFIVTNFLAGLVMLAMYLADTLNQGAWLALFFASFNLQ